MKSSSYKPMYAPKFPFFASLFLKQKGMQNKGRGANGCGSAGLIRTVRAETILTNIDEIA